MAMSTTVDREEQKTCLHTTRKSRTKKTEQLLYLTCLNQLVIHVRVIWLQCRTEAQKLMPTCGVAYLLWVTDEERRSFDVRMTQVKTSSGTCGQQGIVRQYKADKGEDLALRIRRLLCQKTDEEATFCGGPSESAADHRRAHSPKWASQTVQEISRT